MGVIGKVSLLMSADPGPLKRDLGQASGAVRSFSGQVSRASSLVKGAFAAALGGVGIAAGAVAIGKMVRSSSDLTESIGKIGAIFGSQGKSVEDGARKMSDAFGVSLNEMLDSSGKLGGLFKGAGFDEDATAGLSKQFNRLALDASRFFNVPFDVAFNKIRSGLSGEAEPLRDFGVNLTAAKVEAEALALGLNKSGGALSDQAKMSASASLIMKGLADAQGNAAATAGGTAAQIESLSGRFENLMSTLGEGVAPVAGRVLGGVNTALAVVTEMAERANESIFGWVEGLGIAGEGINVIEVAIGGIATAWQSTSLAFQATRITFQAVFSTLVDGAAEVAKVWDGVADAILGTSTGIGERLGIVADSLRDSLAESRKRLADEMAKPWAFRSVADQFQAVRDRVKEVQAEAVKIPNLLASNVASGDGVAPGKKGGGGASDKTLGGAFRSGSVEAAGISLRARFGADHDKAVEKNTKDTADRTKALIDVAKGIRQALIPTSPATQLDL